MITARVRQFMCGLHGHDALLHYEGSRMSLRCTSCGYETPGWDLYEEPATVTPPEEEAGPDHVLVATAPPTA